MSNETYYILTLHTGYEDAPIVELYRNMGDWLLDSDLAALVAQVVWESFRTEYWSWNNLREQGDDWATSYFEAEFGNASIHILPIEVWEVPEHNIPPFVRDVDFYIEVK